MSMSPVAAPTTAVEILSAKPSLNVSAQVFSLGNGPYLLSASAQAMPTRLNGVVFPCLHLGFLDKPDRRPGIFLTAAGPASSLWWSGGETGTFFVTDETAPLIVTTYRIGGAASTLDLSIRALTPERQGPPPFSVTAHIQRKGDTKFDGSNWVGDDQPFWIEGFAIDGLDEPGLTLEYKAASLNRLETNWATVGQYVGTRGKGYALAGLSFRLGGARADAFRLAYKARFLRHGDIEGEPGSVCRSPQPQDPLIGFSLSIEPR